jgi:hypothetical protein
MAAITLELAETMEQIDDVERNLEWKEKCDDIPTLCGADVFPAVDRWAQEARLHWDFRPEPFVGWTVIGWVVALVWACASDVLPPVFAMAGPARYCGRCGANMVIPMPATEGAR